MSIGSELIEVHDHMEQTGCTLEEAIEALNWYEGEIRHRHTQPSMKWESGLPNIQSSSIDETTPF